MPLECDRRAGSRSASPSRVTGHGKEGRLVLVASRGPPGPEGAALSQELTQSGLWVPLRKLSRLNIK